eukprot:SAG11_NODE_1048_length_6038_cov_8.260818_6_plen_64_part_00
MPTAGIWVHRLRHRLCQKTYGKIEGVTKSNKEYGCTCCGTDFADLDLDGVEQEVIRWPIGQPR